MSDAVLSSSVRVVFSSSITFSCAASLFKGVSIVPKSSSGTFASDVGADGEDEGGKAVACHPLRKDATPAIKPNMPTQIYQGKARQ